MDGYIAGPSLLASLNVDWLNRNLLMPLWGLQYSAQYQGGGQICSTVKFNVNLIDVSLKTSGYLDVFTGGHWSKLGMSSHLNVNQDCANIAINGSCGSFSYVGPGSQNLFEDGLCKIMVTLAGYPLLVFNSTVATRMRNPFHFPSTLTVDFSKYSDNGSKVGLEFGHMEGDDWTPEQGNKKEVPVVFGSMAGHSDASGTIPPGESVDYISDAKGLGLGVSIGDESIKFLKETDVKNSIDQIIPFDQNYVMQIAISPMFFGNTNNDTSAHPIGIFGALLPIRIHYMLNVLGYECQVEAFLTSGKAGFGNSRKGDAAVLAAQFDVTKVRVCGSDFISKFLVKEAGATLVLDAPMIGDDNRLTTRYRDAFFYIKTIFGNLLGATDLSEAAKSISDAMPSLGDIANELQISFPDCIKVDNNRVVAVAGCDDFGGAQNGYIKHTQGITKRGARLIISKAKNIVDKDGIYRIMIPAQIVQ